MDILNLQPDAVGKTDDTQQVEGYEDRVEEIANAYPEEDFRTPEEIAEAEALQQELTPEENIQPTALETQNPLPVQEEQPTQPEVQPQPKLFEADEFGMLSDEQLTAAFGKPVPEGLKKGLKLNYAYNEEKENALSELFRDGNNLEKQAQAFYMIKNDPELVTRYDHNNDGEITYDDFFDTTNHEDWDADLGR